MVTHSIVAVSLVRVDAQLVHVELALSDLGPSYTGIEPMTNQPTEIFSLLFHIKATQRTSGEVAIIVPVRRVRTWGKKCQVGSDKVLGAP